MNGSIVYTMPNSTSPRVYRSFTGRYFGMPSA